MPQFPDRRQVERENAPVTHQTEKLTVRPLNNGVGALRLGIAFAPGLETDERLSRVLRPTAKTEAGSRKQPLHRILLQKVILDRLYRGDRALLRRTGGQLILRHDDPLILRRQEPARQARKEDGHQAEYGQKRKCVGPGVTRRMANQPDIAPGQTSQPCFEPAKQSLQQGSVVGGF